MCCASDNHNYMCHTCGKEQIRASIKQLLKKYQIFTILPKISHFHKIVIFQVYLQLRPTASFVYILWQGHVRNTLFHFCQL